MTMQYPKINNEEFMDKIADKFKKYKIPDKKKTLKEFCFPEKYKHQNPQMFVAAYLSPETPYNRVLVYHNIGAGKTCAAIQIAERWKKIRKVYVVLPASLRDNFRTELRSLCTGNTYVTSQERRIMDKEHPTSEIYLETLKKINSRINKYYKILSYNKYVSDYQEGKINLSKSVLIIDEAHNIVSEDGTFYNTIYQSIKEAPRDIVIALMTATPIFDKPVELALLYNLLRPPKEMIVGTRFNSTYLIGQGRNMEIQNKDRLREYLRGFVSYYRGAPPHTFPKKDVHIVKCKMSEFQYRSYKCILKEDMMQCGGGTVKELPMDFFLGARVISNIAFPNKKTNEEGFKSLHKIRLDPETLKAISCKFYKILSKIRRVDGTCFIYSNFKEYGGIKSLERVLQKRGYKNYKTHGEGKKRYAIWSGDESDQVKNEVKTIFNNKNNQYGDRIKLILGTPAIKEGVSLLRVQQVHILEPYWNMSRIKQIMGRAIRYCSHKDVTPDRRTVEVYMYLAVYPGKKTVDQYIYNIAKKKEKITNQFETLLKESAVDCLLNYGANKYDENKYVCKGEDSIRYSESDDEHGLVC